MRNIAFILLSFLFSVSGYCQKVYRSFSTKRLPRVDNTVFKMEKRGSLLGMIIGKDWYPITKEIDFKDPSTEIWYAYYNTNSDTINVYKPGLVDQYSYTLILIPSQKESFTNSTNKLHFSHASHVSHGSHYSSAK